MQSRLFGLLFSVVLLNLAACGNKEAPAPTGATPAAATEEVVKIGSVQPLTGAQSHLGKDFENGVKLALDDANAKGVTIAGKKIKFNLLSEDDQADPKTATIVAQKMVDTKVVGVIGHLNSGTTIPASKIYFDAGIPQISPSATNPKYTEQGFKSAFRVMPNDVQQGKVLGDYAVGKLGVKAIAIVDDRTAYGQGLADEFEKAAKAAGAQIVAREFTTDKSTDFMAILTAIKAKKPELVFFGGMDTQAAPMVKQMRSLGLTAKFLGGDGMSTPEFIKLASGGAEDAYSSLPGLPLLKMPGGSAFHDRFNAKYGAIQLYAPYSFDAASVLIAAMQKADSTDPVKYLPVLAAISHEGVTAKVMFDAKGDIKDGAVTLYQVKNGKWEALETMGGATPPAPPAAAVPDAAQPPQIK